MNTSLPRSRLSPVTLWFLFLVIIIAAYGCNFPQAEIPVTGPEERDTREEPSQPEEQPVQDTPSSTFSSDRASLSIGECAILEWNIKGVEVVQLNESPVNHISSREVCPDVSTTYTLRGFSGGGPPVFEKAIEINVIGEQQSEPTQAQEHPMNTYAPPPKAPVVPAAPAAPAAKSCPGKPVISFFNANPTTINAGQTAVLSWDASSNSPAGSLQNVNINNGVGNMGAKGDENVKPVHTTTYTLTADGCGGSVTRTVTVTVTQPPAAPPGGGSSGVLTADMRVTDLFPDSGGHVFTRVVNNGPGSPSNVDFGLACETTTIQIGNPNAKSTSFNTTSFNISIVPGQEIVQSTGITVDLSNNTYEITCYLTEPFKDPKPANNSYTEKIP